MIFSQFPLVRYNNLMGYANIDILTTNKKCVLRRANKITTIIDHFLKICPKTKKNFKNCLLVSQDYINFFMIYELICTRE